MNKAKGKDKVYMGCRCYERLQPNTKEFTRLAYTELMRGLFAHVLHLLTKKRGKKHCFLVGFETSS
jgi:hypothetical protein